MTKAFLSLVTLLSITTLNAQVGIGTILPKTTLEVVGKPGEVSSADGVMAPKITRAELIAKTAYTSNQTGAILYVTDLSGTPNTATSRVTKIGYFYFNGTLWENLSNSGILSYSEPISITATTSNPAKATTREVDIINLVDDGSGWCTVTMIYTAAASAGANNGTGTFLFKLPAGYQFDINTHPINSQTGNLSGQSEIAKVLISEGRMVNIGYSQYVNAIPHSATHFKLLGTFGESGGLTYWAFLSSSYLGINQANTHYSISFRFKKQ